MALLEIRNLSVSFAPRSGPFRAVDGVDLTVDQDEVVAIVGESGSGKSVAMLAVMGLLPWTATVTADRMRFDGRDLLHDLAARAPPDHRARHRDDLPGADDVAEPVFHGRLPDRRDAARRISGLDRGARRKRVDRAAGGGRHHRPGAAPRRPSRTSCRAA